MSDDGDLRLTDITTIWMKIRDRSNTWTWKLPISASFRSAGCTQYYESPFHVNHFIYLFILQ